MEKFSAEQPKTLEGYFDELTVSELPESYLELVTEKVKADWLAETNNRIEKIKEQVKDAAINLQSQAKLTLENWKKKEAYLRYQEAMREQDYKPLQGFGVRRRGERDVYDGWWRIEQSGIKVGSLVVGPEGKVMEVRNITPTALLQLEGKPGPVSAASYNLAPEMEISEVA
ncbi:MAG TPA: hypothetical protein VMX18_02900 [Candidatus Bipolaricaulota bacterium]|nr:hypothetical protein [Candidatus Bipolaricaulota bacterium]